MKEPDDGHERQSPQLFAGGLADQVRRTMAFAGLYQITHELIKAAVLQDLREFYARGEGLDGSTLDERSYTVQVLRHDVKRPFRASLLWLVEAGAISQQQADRLDEIYEYRHELTHNLIAHVGNPNYKPDVELYMDALKILVDLRVFWEVKASMTGGGSFDPMLLGFCLGAAMS